MCHQRWRSRPRGECVAAVRSGRLLEAVLSGGPRLSSWERGLGERPNREIPRVAKFPQGAPDAEGAGRFGQPLSEARTGRARRPCPVLYGQSSSVAENEIFPLLES
jgi:hypothetical protein